MTKITIIGAGISGLAAAYRLSQENDCNVTVLEAGKEPGGSMISRRESGFLIDLGPNSGLDTTPEISRMVQETGIIDEMIYADRKSNKRYILRQEKLHALPLGPGAFLITKLFSRKAKWRLLKEPFIDKSDDGYFQSVSEFVIRRLGQEFLDYAINPFVAGVFAGDPDMLSVKSAFPKLYRLEEVYGGLIKGMIKGAKERKQSQEKSKQSARMFSFKNGMQAFPKALAEKLGDRVQYNCGVQEINRINNRFKVTFTRNSVTEELEADIVLSAIPAYEAAAVFNNMDPELNRHLNDIYYPPVKMLFLGFEKSMVGRKLDGFGYLIPEKEKKSYLGAIWSSVIFSERAPEDVAAFTLYIGGARSPELFEQDSNQLTENVIREFKEIMDIEASPIFIKERMWSKAIPQYTVGYIEHERYFEQFEKNHPGLFLSGNYRGGISVGDCIKNSVNVGKRVMGYMKESDKFK